MRLSRIVFSCTIAVCFFCIGWISSNVVFLRGTRLSHKAKYGVLEYFNRAKWRGTRSALHTLVMETTENISIQTKTSLTSTPAAVLVTTPAVEFQSTVQSKGASNDIKPTQKWKGKLATYHNFHGAYDIGSKMELFFDDFIISNFSSNIERSTSKKIRQSQVVLKLEHPWEKSTGFLNYANVVKNEQDGSFLMYYRCYAYRLGIDKIPPWNNTRPYVTDRNYCVAKSTDGGKTFTKPLLDHYRWGRDNVKTNIIAVMLDAFTPIYDGRPNVPQNERFKAFGARRQNIWNLYASSDGISWRIVKKEVLDRRDIIKKKLGLIYAYDSTMNLGYDDDAKTFSVFTRGVKKWTQRTVMSGVVQGDNRGDWTQWQDKNSKSKPSADFRLIQVNPPFEPYEGIYSSFPQKGIGGSQDQFTRHLWFMPATRYHGGKLFPLCPNKTISRMQHIPSYCELGLTDVQFLFSRDSPFKSSQEKRGMRWSRPVVLDAITDFGSPHDIYDNSRDIKIRHFEQRRTWAVGGIHPIPGKDEFQFFVLHNSWLPTAHIKRYVIPRYRFGSVMCRTNYLGHGGQKEKVCSVVTKPIHLRLDESHSNLYLNVKALSIFGYVQVGVLDALCNGAKGESCAYRREALHNLSPEQAKNLSHAFGFFSAGTSERIIEDELDKVVRWSWYGPPKWWDKRTFIDKNPNEVRYIEETSKKAPMYNIRRLTRLLKSAFPDKDTYPIQLQFLLKDAEIFGFRLGQ